MSYVTVEKLSKSFKGNKIIDNLDFTIEKGEFVTLLGPSGCGKSTLLRCIAGLEQIDGGEICIDGKEVSRLGPRDRGIGMVFQSYALFPNMTVRENIGFGLKMKRVNERERREKVDAMMELVDIADKAEARIQEISGGQQQRVALARALAVEPKILLLDEPLSALDAKIRKSLRLQLRNIQKQLKITTVFVTHDQEEALTMSDRIFVFDKGRISQMGTPADIYSLPQNEFVAGFIGNYNMLTSDDVEEISGARLEGELFAIRPEVISVYGEAPPEKGGVLHLRGIVEDTVVLGSILRCYLDVKNRKIVADMLNREENYFEKGEEVQLLISQKEISRIR
ncbi:MAG: transporter ATP-binding protein [Firmicutes bacterium]|nr:transporter ATP-binding protein [Bacillota bacterium]